MKQIRPVAELGRRVQEAGKLRMGVKVPASGGKKSSMKSIETWRMTSPHRDCIDQLAELYGGTPRPWSDPKATHRDQFEVITEAKTIQVAIPPGGLSTNYELWAGSGCVRRCDGEKVQIPSKAPDEDFTVEPCLCYRENKMECKPYSRLIVVFPDITFRGIWTLTTKSWNAADELPAIERMIDQLQATQDIISVDLTIEQRSQMTASGKKNFVVPVLSIPHTLNAITQGAARLGLAGPPTPELDSQQRALTAGSDEAVVDAELVVEPEDVLPEVRRLANLLILNPTQLETGVALGVSEGAKRMVMDLDEDECRKAMAFLDDVGAERIEIRGVKSDDRLTIVRKS